MNIIQQFSASKESINSMVNEVVNEVKEGNLNPLNVLIAAKAMEKVFKEINEKTKEEQLSEAQKYNQRSFEAYGAKIEVAELGTSYNYDECNDPEYINLLIEKKLLDDKIKARQEFLKKITTPFDMLLDGGDVVKICPPIKSSKTGLKVTI